MPTKRERKQQIKILEEKYFKSNDAVKMAQIADKIFDEVASAGYRIEITDDVRRIIGASKSQLDIFALSFQRDPNVIMPLTVGYKLGAHEAISNLINLIDNSKLSD